MGESDEAAMEPRIEAEAASEAAPEVESLEALVPQEEAAPEPEIVASPEPEPAEAEP